jgi:hypothetical protein
LDSGADHAGQLRAAAAAAGRGGSALRLRTAGAGCCDDWCYSHWGLQVESAHSSLLLLLKVRQHHGDGGSTKVRETVSRSESDAKGTVLVSQWSFTELASWRHEGMQEHREARCCKSKASREGRAVRFDGSRYLAIPISKRKRLRRKEPQVGGEVEKYRLVRLVVLPWRESAARKQEKRPNSMTCT